MENTLNTLRESKNWLKKAIQLLETDTLDSLLEYYQVGYTSGTWHFPSIAAKYNHEVAAKLSGLLNQYLEPIGFYIDEDKAGISSEFVLYYGEKPKSGGNSMIRSGKYICSVNMNRRYMYSSTDYESKIENLEDMIESEKKRIEKLKEDKRNIETWLKNNSGIMDNIIKKKQIKLNRKALELSDDYIAKETEAANDRIKNLQGDIARTESLKQNLSKLVNTLTPLGFVFDGYFVRNHKKYSLYLLVERDEKVIQDSIQAYSSGGIYRLGPFIAFDKSMFNQKDIKDLKKQIPFKHHEIWQKNFEKLMFNGKKYSIAVDSISFNLCGEEEPVWLKNQLSESLNSSETTSLAYVIRNYQEEGYDVQSLSFKLANHTIHFNRFAEIDIQADEVETKKILHSDAISTLLGLIR